MLVGWASCPGPPLGGYYSRGFPSNMATAIPLNTSSSSGKRRWKSQGSFPSSYVKIELERGLRAADMDTRTPLLGDKGTHK